MCGVKGQVRVKKRSYLLTGIQASETRIPPLGAVVSVAVLVGFVGAVFEFEVEVEVVGGGDGVVSSIVKVSKLKSVVGGGDSKSKNMESESARSRCIVSEFVLPELSISL
jgi:hypothetical protein